MAVAWEEYSFQFCQLWAIKRKFIPISTQCWYQWTHISWKQHISTQVSDDLFSTTFCVSHLGHIKSNMFKQEHLTLVKAYLINRQNKLASAPYPSPLDYVLGPSLVTWGGSEFIRILPNVYIHKFENIYLKHCRRNLLF